MTDTRQRIEHLVTEMEKLDLRSVIEELHTEVQALAIRCAQARRIHFQECARLECHRCNGGMPVLILTERMHELLVACLIDAAEDASLPLQEDVRKLLNIVRAAKRMDGAHA